MSAREDLEEMAAATAEALGHVAREDLEEMAAATAEALGHVAPEGVGFAVLFFDFGDAGSCAYAANAERDGVIKALRETADRLEAGEGERRQRGV